jgi:hypothetical protein
MESCILEQRNVWIGWTICIGVVWTPKQVGIRIPLGRIEVLEQKLAIRSGSLMNLCYFHGA